MFGDILAQRMKVRGVAGLVTDGVMRDKAGVLETGLPVWCAGVAAPPSVAGLTFVGWQEPVGCGGCAIYPGDVVVADGDGAVVIPAALADEVARLGTEQEELEAWLMDEVKAGRALPGLYPPNEETMARYKARKKTELLRSRGLLVLGRGQHVADVIEQRLEAQALPKGARGGER